MFFKKSTAFEVWQQEFEKINLDFETSYKHGYTLEGFIYLQCNEMLEHVAEQVPKRFYEYVALDLIAQDFYNLHKPLLVYKHGFLFVTKKYLENYSNFLTTEARASDI